MTSFTNDKLKNAIGNADSITINGDLFIDISINNGVINVMGEDDEQISLTFEELEKAYNDGSLELFKNKKIELDDSNIRKFKMDEMMAFIGSDQDPKDYLLDLLNGKYPLSSFRVDVAQYE
ncbi:hypothetical protein [Aliivibrio fischeri]|uniref:hypothetical protein n=1 Tax=Aliivibrio fischeri TaxID=668 RepID=UPI0007C53475|nr:hypothetical protein [Aliivibrio fischeri]